MYHTPGLPATEILPLGAEKLRASSFDLLVTGETQMSIDLNLIRSRSSIEALVAEKFALKKSGTRFVGVVAIEGVALEQLRRRTLDELEAAALAVAQADRRRRAEPGSASPAPKRWDVAPKLRVTIHRNGLWVGPGESASDAGNH